MENILADCGCKHVIKVNTQYLQEALCNKMSFEVNDDAIGTNSDDESPSAADSFVAWREIFKNPGASLI